MSDFDFSRIPNNVLHDAAQQVLSGCDLSPNSKVEYNFRCPLCGDSQKSLHKKRGYVYFAKNAWIFVCFNCGKTMSFISFLKIVDQELYKKVLFHGFTHDNNYKKTKIIEEDLAVETYKPTGIAVFKPKELISILDQNPLAKLALDLCEKRKIRREVYSGWFVCLKGQEFYDRTPTGEVILNENGFPKGNEYGYRLIIPYYKYGSIWSQFDARDLREKSPLRYRNLEGVDKEFYNIDWLDVSKPFFLLEGAVDATFIKNAVSFGGIKGLNELLKQHPEITQNINNATIIWDNDDAGKDEIEKTVKMGFSWFNWSDIKPSDQFKYNEDGSERIIKDINDSVMYTDFMDRDEEQYIKLECLQKYIEKPNLIKVVLLFGDRKKIKYEKSKEQMKNLRKNNITSKNKTNPFLGGEDMLAFLYRK